MRLLQDPPRLLTTTLLGTNLSSIALTTIGTLLLVDIFGGRGELMALMTETTGAIAAFSQGQVRRVLRFAQMTAAEAMWPVSDVPCRTTQASTPSGMAGSTS